MERKPTKTYVLVINISLFDGVRLGATAGVCHHFADRQQDAAGGQYEHKNIDIRTITTYDIRNWKILKFSVIAECNDASPLGGQGFIPARQTVYLHVKCRARDTS